MRIWLLLAGWDRRMDWKRYRGQWGGHKVLENYHKLIEIKSNLIPKNCGSNQNQIIHQN